MSLHSYHINENCDRFTRDTNYYGTAPQYQATKKLTRKKFPWIWTRRQFVKISNVSHIWQQLGNSVKDQQSSEIWQVLSVKQSVRKLSGNLIIFIPFPGETALLKWSRKRYHQRTGIFKKNEFVWKVLTSLCSPKFLLVDNNNFWNKRSPLAGK